MQIMFATEIEVGLVFVIKYIHTIHICCHWKESKINSKIMRVN